MSIGIEHIRCRGKVKWFPIPSCKKCGHSFGISAFKSSPDIIWYKIPKQNPPGGNKHGRLHPARWPLLIRWITVGIVTGVGVLIWRNLS